MCIRSIGIEPAADRKVIDGALIIRKIKRIQKGPDLYGGIVGQSASLPEILTPACEVLCGVVGL